MPAAIAAPCGGVFSGGTVRAAEVLVGEHPEQGIGGNKQASQRGHQ